MKIRTDYVSNSSSSSFIVISSNGFDKTAEISRKYYKHSEAWNRLAIPCTGAKHEFGWEFENTSDFLGKLNFIAIQLCNLLIIKMRKMNNDDCRVKYDFDKCYDMLEKVCKEKFGILISLNEEAFTTNVYHSDDAGYYLNSKLGYDFYIDHQSCVTEDRCMEMFDSEDALYNFLRYEESYVEGGNDNESY